MKSMKIALTALALVVGIGGAFASKAINGTTAWYYLDASGNPSERLADGDSPDCDPGTLNCAQQFNVVNNQPTTAIGQPVKGAIHSN